MEDLGIYHIFYAYISQHLSPRHESASVLSSAPALSSDSDKDGEDEGNDEDELHSLHSLQMQTNSNNERNSGIKGEVEVIQEKRRGTIGWHHHLWAYADLELRRKILCSNCFKNHCKVYLVAISTEYFSIQTYKENDGELAGRGQEKRPMRFAS